MFTSHAEESSSSRPASGARKKRRVAPAVSTDSSLDHMRESVGRVGLQSDLEQTVWRKLQEDPSDSLQDCELDVCQVISSCGYKDMLENLFHNVDAKLPDVPILTRAYEERLMRQPMSGETPCAMGELCECQFIDRRMPFTAVELRFPNDPPTPQMCVICCRKTTQKLFFDMCFTGKKVKGVIQRCVRPSFRRAHLVHRRAR